MTVERMFEAGIGLTVIGWFVGLVFTVILCVYGFKFLKWVASEVKKETEWRVRERSGRNTQRKRR